MRIISAHYAWNGFDGFVKNPQLHLDDDHRVVELISLGDKYIEKAHTEFYGGLLVPGFISEVNAKLENHDDMVQLLNQVYINGSLYVVTNEYNYQEFELSRPVKPKVLVFKDESINKDQLRLSSDPFQTIKYNIESLSQNNIIFLLKEYLADPWRKSKFNDIGGSFDIGKRPGVLLLTGIDWDSLTFTNNIKLRIIDCPY